MLRRIPIAILVLMLLASAAQAAQAPKNVILMIGDGMGFAQVSMARLSLEGKALKMDSMRSGGMLQTMSANALITDSAAAGTALATGFKTNNGMVSSFPDGATAETILEAAQKMGKAAGLVTTTTITHATPASFGSHVPARDSEADIAPQFIEKKIDVLMGGGRQFFVPKSIAGSKRADERDLISEARAAGYEIVKSRESMISSSSNRLLALFQMDALTTNPPEPSLAQMTTKAIEVLSKDPQGFFLMVEGGQIDWQCHVNNARGSIKQTLDFDDAIGEALRFASSRGDTLVIVTADHETGGLTLHNPAKGEATRFDPSSTKWSTTNHTGCDVPVLADGPGADQFSGVLNNTDIPKRIAHLWKVKAFPVRR